MIFYPDYFDTFTCLAGACPDSCCQEWEVDVDAAAVNRYRALPGALGDQLRQVLRQEDGAWYMTIEDRRCPMWRKDGLCRIQAELGHEALCHTCREYPRLTHDYGDFVEKGLELSCPEAARLIFAGTQRWKEEPLPNPVEPEYDREIMEILRESRKHILEYLHGNIHPLSQSLGVLLLYAHQVQEAMDGGEAEALNPDRCLETAVSFQQTGDEALFLDFFRNLDLLTHRWEARLQAPQGGPWNENLRPMAIYLVERYWLQSVSDYDLIGRAKWIVSACILAHLLGGDPVQTAQLMSKELENSAQNMDAILDGAYTAPALTDVNLLSLLQLRGQ